MSRTCVIYAKAPQSATPELQHLAGLFAQGRWCISSEAHHRLQGVFVHQQALPNKQCAAVMYPPIIFSLHPQLQVIMAGIWPTHL